MMKKILAPLFFMFITCVAAYDNPCFKDYTPLESELDTWTQDMVNPYQSSLSSTADDIKTFPNQEITTVSLLNESQVEFHGHSKYKPENSEGAFYGGLFKFTVPEEGTYRVSLGVFAWVDFVEIDTMTFADATNYALQEECPGIKKMVEFKLKPDVEYVLQLSANEQQYIRMMIFRIGD